MSVALLGASQRVASLIYADWEHTYEVPCALSAFFIYSQEDRISIERGLGLNLTLHVP